MAADCSQRSYPIHQEKERTAENRIEVILVSPAFPGFSDLLLIRLFKYVLPLMVSCPAFQSVALGLETISKDGRRKVWQSTTRIRMLWLQKSQKEFIRWVRQDVGSARCLKLIFKLPTARLKEQLHLTLAQWPIVNPHFINNTREEYK